MGTLQPALDLEAGGVIATSQISPVPKQAAQEPEVDSDSDLDSSSDEHVSDDLDSDMDGAVSEPFRPDSNFSIRQCDCFPDNETKEQCRARIARIVEEQRKCYGRLIVQHVLIPNREERKPNPGMAGSRAAVQVELWPDHVSRGYTGADNALRDELWSDHI
jgi:hypothetical protein